MDTVKNEEVRKVGRMNARDKALRDAVDLWLKFDDSGKVRSLEDVESAQEELHIMVETWYEEWLEEMRIQKAERGN